MTHAPAPDHPDPHPRITVSTEHGTAVVERETVAVRMGAAAAVAYGIDPDDLTDEMVRHAGYAALNAMREVSERAAADHAAVRAASLAAAVPPHDSLRRRLYAVLAGCLLLVATLATLMAVWLPPAAGTAR